MLVDPSVVSVTELVRCKWAKCNATSANSTSCCINPCHYVKIEARQVAGPSATTSCSSSLSERLHGDKLQNLSAMNPNCDALQFSSDPVSSPSHTSSLNMLQPNVAYSQIVEYEPVQHWCSVAYYEGETRLGELYQADENQFQIDGLTDPSSSQRYCIGIINSTSRDALTRQVRRVLGKEDKFLGSRQSFCHTFFEIVFC